jgi:hypothetical protein
MGRWKSLVLLPDLQVPLHDRKYVDALVRFVREFKPDELHNVGDLVDSPEPARWNKGMAGEFLPTLQKGFDESIAINRAFRDALGDKPFHLKTGNHDERTETYVQKYAPALASLRALKLEDLLEADSYGLKVERSIYDVAPGWVIAHGHEGGSSRTPGGVAFGLSTSIGKSVACGHTHKVGLIASAEGYNGRLKNRFGLEVGHAMDVRKAHYLKTGGAKWTQGFGILRVKGNTVIPEAVIVQGRSFVVEGKTYDF